MVEKVVEIVGISNQSFSKAAENAVAECAKTVRNIRWASVKELDCKVEGNKIAEFHSLVRIYFDVER